MREMVHISALALTVALAAGSATAQTQQPEKAQQTEQKQQSTEALKQGSGPETQRALGAPDSPPQHQVIGPPNAGPVPVMGEATPDILGGSPQTVPAKFSAENAAKDDRWWLDRGQELTAEQKQAIFAQLARNGAQAGAGMKIFAEPSALVPIDAQLYDMPRELAAQIPYIEHFKYVVDQNKVVLVDPVNGTVAAVIDK